MFVQKKWAAYFRKIVLPQYHSKMAGQIFFWRSKATILKSPADNKPALSEYAKTRINYSR